MYIRIELNKNPQYFYAIGYLVGCHVTIHTIIQYDITIRHLRKSIVTLIFKSHFYFYPLSISFVQVEIRCFYALANEYHLHTSSTFIIITFFFLL